MAEPSAKPVLAPWQARLHEIIFEADTPSGKAFDVALLVAIVISVTAAVLESVKSVRDHFGEQLLWIEWTLTVLFTIEYVLRLACVGRPAAYAKSFFGVVDLTAILPTYLSIFFSGAQSLIVIRALRLLRVFRVLKLAYFVNEAAVLASALRASRRKIIIFLGTVITVVVILGSLMYVIEGEDYGFTSIPMSIYWAIVTVTTVGYGDIAPQTVPGKFLASAAMIIGYAIIAVPTGIVTAELVQARSSISTQACPQCAREGHDTDAIFCKFCGAALNPPSIDDEAPPPFPD